MQIHQDLRFSTIVSPNKIHFLRKSSNHLLFYYRSFELWVPVRLIPLGLKIGDVIRIKSVVASVLADFKHVLVPTDHSNLLLIHHTFKLYKRFHNKEQSTMHDLTLAILGCSNKPVNQR